MQCTASERLSHTSEAQTDTQTVSSLCLRSIMTQLATSTRAEASAKELSLFTWSHGMQISMNSCSCVRTMELRKTALVISSMPCGFQTYL